ncbi:hypothetical protein ACPV5G_20635 [Photobacterium damselae]|uniref:hypothetical protein n=1 Tax=Photobacterium damselae TaxID=38293 RepID=UPI00406968D8
MGGGSDEVEETEAERAASEVAAKQWDVYNNDLKEFENTFISRVDNLNSDQNMAKAKQGVDLNYASSFGQARQKTSQNMTASGIDPSSSKYQSAMGDIQTKQAIDQTDTVGRAQTAEQDRYMAGLQDVVALGAGQKAEALSAMGDVANNSLRKSVVDAEDAFNKKAANAQLAGAVVGAGARYGLRNVGSLNFNSSTVDGVSTVKPISTYDFNSNPDGTMVS